MFSRITFAFSRIGQFSTATTKASRVFALLPADKEFPDIVINPTRLSGQPTFVGGRVSPASIAGMANGGMRSENIAADYGLSLQQVRQAIDYTKKYRLESA